MDALTIAFRALHFAGTLALFGEFVFELFVARPALRPDAGGLSEERLALRRRLLRAAARALAVVLASGIGWLAVQAAAASGLPLERALNAQTLREVLEQTLFGRVCEIRFGLAVALGALLLFGRRAAGEHSALIVDACAALLAGALLAALAWTGHAAAEQGTDRAVHLCADALHLLAAGAWLGALAPLAFVLGRAARAGANGLRFAARATRRFSFLGMASVGVLLVSGGANAWYTVGSFPALFGTDYGRLLLAKLALFAAMVVLAAVNRMSLSPQLAAPSGDSGAARRALRRLRRNAIAETALGLAVVGIVGALGASVPALHVQPVWPFSFTLDWEAAEASAGVFVAVSLALAAAVAAGVLALFGASRSRRGVAVAGGAGSLAALAAVAWLLAVPAYPTTYVGSPIQYTADSVARGAPLYAQHCALCHGPYGYGDGPAAASLPVKPANLAEHVFHHREGDILWWIAHGIAGTPMPAFGDRIGEAGLWDLLNFLRAQGGADEARALRDSVEPWRAIAAPDFTFQIDHGEQESLAQQRGRNAVLLVFYALPESLARLRALAEAKDALHRAGARVIAIPVAETASARQGLPGIDASMLAESDPRVVAAYAMFRRTEEFRSDPGAPGHVEFLIDRQGYLRARWTRSAGQGWDRMPELLCQVEILDREKPHPPPARSHVH